MNVRCEGCYPTKVVGFGPLYRQAFLRPARALAELVEHPRAPAFGALAVAITGAVYTAVYVFLAHNGGRPTAFVPWLDIPAGDYYQYNQWMHLPSIFLAWVTASGFTQLFARGLGGRGSFEQTLAALGFGISISSWWTGLHDLITSFLGMVGVMDQRAFEDALNTPTPQRTLLWILMAGYVVWFLMLFTKGVRAAHRLSIPRSAVAGVTGYFIYQLIFLIFNR